MNYQTITLGLIQANPHRHERLRASRMLLPTMEAYARDLRSRHLDLIDQLQARQPHIDPRLIANRAMELAVAELESRLSSAD